MARVNTTITLSYEIYMASKKHRLGVSKICEKALEKEIIKLEKG